VSHAAPTSTVSNPGWLRHAVAGQPRVRLLCIGHAGGGASSFNGWRRVLPEWIELLKVQLPGREDRRDCQPIADIRQIVPSLFRDIEKLGALPIALYGHSMGAIVSFEVVRAMRRRELEPLLLAISGRRAPHRLLPPGRAMHDLPNGALVDRLVALGGFSQPLLHNPRWRDYYLPIIRADLSVSDAYTYHPEPPLSCPVRAFLGVNDNLVVRPDWEAWNETTSGDFARYLLPGGHFFSKEGQGQLISTLVSAIVETLQAAGCARPGITLPSATATDDLLQGYRQ
jgi:medium-chain acyl-[acyl-carrier-protein] hydrolase